MPSPLILPEHLQQKKWQRPCPDFDLEPKGLDTVVVTGLYWDEDTAKWTVTTDTLGAILKAQGID